MTLRAKPLTDTVPSDAFDVAADMLTRDKRRSRRARLVRKATVGIRSLTMKQLHQGAIELKAAGCSREDYLALDEQRPRTRGDCQDVARPCPYVACRHHLYLDVTKQGGLTLNFPDLEPEELLDSCSLDLAELGEQQLEAVGAAMNITRERVRQIQCDAEERIGKRRLLDEWEGHVNKPREER